jgi:preprotein translocase subunit SecG
MIPILLTIILVIVLPVSISILIKRRKDAGVTGFKSALTSICFFLIAFVNLISYWMGWLGMFNWMMTIILLLAGAYYSKYLLPAGTEN